MTKQKRRRDKDDPIGDYIEWTDHRYTPGYYTGGRLSPTIKAWQRLFSPREKRILVYLVLAAAIAGAGWWFWHG